MKGRIFMNIKKILTSVLVASVMTLSTTTGTFISADDKQADDDILKIMCIGDSITDGYGTEGSYRKFLYHNLTSNGYKIDMVGMKDGGYTPSYTDEDTGETFTYDNENAGYSGYTIQNYNGRSGIYETIKNADAVKSNLPDIVILQIGTNDVIDNHELNDAGNRLSVLVNYILDNLSYGSQLYVTTIPDLDPNRSDVYSWFGNYRHSSDWQTQYDDSTAEKNVHKAVSSYNETVKETISKLSLAHTNLHFANVNSAITDVKMQLKDGVHPNNTGYKLMGNYWTEIIENYLSGKTIPDSSQTQASTTEPATTTTSTTNITTAITTTTEITTTTVTTSTTSTSSSASVDKSIDINAETISDLQKFILNYDVSNSDHFDLSKMDFSKDRKINAIDLAILKRLNNQLDNAGYSFDDLNQSISDMLSTGNSDKINEIINDVPILKNLF